MKGNEGFSYRENGGSGSQEESINNKTQLSIQVKVFRVSDGEYNKASTQIVSRGSRRSSLRVSTQKTHKSKQVVQRLFPKAESRYPIVALLQQREVSNSLK